MTQLHPDDFSKGMLFTVLEHSPIFKGMIPKMEQSPEGQPSVSYVPLNMPNNENKGSIFRIVTFDLPYVVAEVIADADLQGIGNIPMELIKDMMNQAAMGYQNPVQQPNPYQAQSQKSNILYPRVVFDVRTVKLMPISKEYAVSLITDEVIRNEVLINSKIHNSKND